MHEKEPEKDVEAQGEHASLPSSRCSSPALTKEPDITAVGAPPANTEDVLKLASHESRETDLSEDELHRQAKIPRPKGLSRANSRASTIHPDAVKVPRGERRGLLARLAVVAEVRDPYDYSRKTKWLVTFVVAIAGAAAPMGSSIILRKFHRPLLTE